MRRARILVLLLCACALTAPLVSRAASNDGGECKAGFCGSDSQCPGGTCHKDPGQTCGVCLN